MSGTPIPILTLETAVTEQNLADSMRFRREETRPDLPPCPLQIVSFLRDPADLSVQQTSGRPQNRDFAVQQRGDPSTAIVAAVSGHRFSEYSRALDPWR
jgi:hypothetical protein